MDTLQLMKDRHSVRQYINQPIEQDKRFVINKLIKEILFPIPLNDVPV